MSKVWKNVWKGQAQSQFLKMTQQHRQEFFASLLKEQHNALELKGGVVEGAIYDAAGLDRTV